MPLCLEGLLYKWRLPLVARRPPQHVLVLDTGKNLAHLRLLVVMHGYEVVDVVEVHRPGSPRRRCDAFAFQIDASMTAIWRAGFAVVAFVPHVSLGGAPRRLRRSHAIVRCKLAFLEGLYSALLGRSCPEIGLSGRLEAALRSPGLGAVDLEQSCGSWQGSHHCLRLSLRWGQHKL